MCTIKKYLVVANTFQGCYGCETTLFHIADSLEEAVEFILNYTGDFDFFAHYEPERHILVDTETDEPVHKFTLSKGKLLDAKEKVIPESKEEYAMQYIQMFDGKPAVLGGYVE